MATPAQPSGRRLLGGILRLPQFEPGYDALERGNAEAAFRYFQAEVERDPAPEAFEALGMAASMLDDEAALFEARQAAYELYRRRGDDLGAARVAAYQAEDWFTFRGQMAVANGWLQRARTLLEGHPAGPEHGWLWIMDASKALLVDNDGPTTRDAARRANEVARAHGDGDLEAVSLALEGISMVIAGQVREGMGHLDEAAARCVSGEVRAPWCISSVLCYMMDACDRTRDWERAHEWFTQVQRLAEHWGNRLFYAQCRPHYAVLLTWRGDWQAAEDELHRSIDELTAIRKPMAAEGIIRLAELRARQGRYEEAEALFEQARHDSLSHLGLAALHLERGRLEAARELVEGALRRLPPGDRIERLPACELLVRVCLAQGDMERARQVLPELTEISQVAATRPVLAAVHRAMGLLKAAEDDLEGARDCLADAVEFFGQSSAPYEAARARIELAEVLTRLHRSDDAARESAAAIETLTRLGAEAAVREAPGQAPDSAETHAGPLSPREREVLRLLAQGLSNQEIADALVLSIRTVQRHVENIYTKTGARGRVAAARFAAQHHLV